MALLISLPAAGNAMVFDNAVAQMNQPWVCNASVALLYGYRNQAVCIMDAIHRLLKCETDSPLQYLPWVVTGPWFECRSVKCSPVFQEHFVSNIPRDSRNPHLKEYWEEKYNYSLNEESCSIASPARYVKKYIYIYHPLLMYK